jgi:acyl-CoA thioester hydrolase
MLDKRPNYEDFTLRTYDKVRYGDTDSQGHINNAVFSTFLETGRCELFNRMDFLGDNNIMFGLASVKLNLMSEITWPGTVEIGTAITKIGNSSISFFQGLYQKGKLVAVAEAVSVRMDETTRESKSLSDEMKEELRKYLMV